MKVEIYTKDACPYCVQAKNLMKSKGWEFTEHYISADNRESMIAEMSQRIGQIPRTVPQIFIDDQAIGGYTDLVTWVKNQNA